SKRGSVNVALAIQDQAAVGVRSVLAAAEAVQHFLRPLAALFLWWTQLEYRSAVLIETIASCPMAAAELGCSVEIPGAVEDQIPVRQIALLGGGEAVQHRLGPRAALLFWR